MKKKLRLTKKEIEAVKDSIRHWKEDIRAQFLSGDVIEQGPTAIWRDAGLIVLDGGNACPLCTLTGPDCIGCPYNKKYGHDCDDEKGHWNKWRIHKTLKYCNLMIKALERILE
jgi:hypothetical protein